MDRPVDAELLTEWVNKPRKGVPNKIRISQSEQTVNRKDLRWEISLPFAAPLRLFLRLLNRVFCALRVLLAALSPRILVIVAVSASKPKPRIPIASAMLLVPSGP